MDEGQSNTLEIMPVKLGDSGIYTATLTNEHGSLSSHCNLVVDNGIRAYGAPQFAERMKSDYVVDSGGEIYLTAQIEAYPSVGVNWYRNNIRIRPSRRIQLMLYKDGFVQLFISNATDADAGNYKCIATNAAGNADCECCIIVEKNLNATGSFQSGLPLSNEPVFMNKPKHLVAYDGDAVIIDLKVAGDPSPEVIWQRDCLKVNYLLFLVYISIYINELSFVCLFITHNPIFQSSYKFTPLLPAMLRS